MVDPFQVTAGEIHKLTGTITAESGDPSTSGTAAFAVNEDQSTAPAAGSFEDGEWVGSYDADTDKIGFATPTIGASGATLELTAGNTYSLWIRVVDGSETWVSYLDELEAR